MRSLLTAGVVFGGLAVGSLGCGHWNKDRCPTGCPPGGTRGVPTIPPTPLPPGMAPGAAPRGDILMPAPLPPAGDTTGLPLPPPPRVDARRPDLTGPPGGVRLLPPDLAVVPRAETPAPPRAGEPGPSPALPVGIPEFADARDRVATGRKPSLDGLDWLQANGYRTVLHLRKPGESGAADRAQVEKRGLRYESMEVAPEALTERVMVAFNRLVTDPDRLP